MWYNIRGIRRKRNDLIALIQSCPEIDVLMLQETECSNEIVLSSFRKQLLMNGCLLVNDKPEDRVLTVIRVERINEHTVVYKENRTQVIQITSGKMQVTLVNHYGPHRSNEGDVHYKNLVEVLRVLACQGKLILGGDHNTVAVPEDRSSKRLDPNSGHFKSLLEGLQLKSVNEITGDPHFHTFFRKKYTSRIDSIWCNSAAADVVQKVEHMSRNGVSSDHIPTMVRLKWCVSNTNKVQGDRKYKFPKKESAIWHKFAQELVDKLDTKDLSELSVDNMCDVITDTLVEGAKIFEVIEDRASGTDNRRIKRWLKDRQILVDALCRPFQNEKISEVCSHYASGGPTNQVQDALTVVDGLIHKERSRRASVRFSKWCFKARTSEYKDPRFFFNAATAKKSRD